MRQCKQRVPFRVSRDEPRVRTAARAAVPHAVGLALLLGATAILILTALAVSARAETADPYDILDRHVEALGGMDALRANASFHMEGTLEVAGLSGSVERWQGAGGRFRQELDLGVFRETSGDDGSTAWTVDANGKVQFVEDENALIRRKVESRVAAYEMFDRDSDVFDATYVGLDELNGRACHLVRITNSLNDDAIEMWITADDFREIRRRETTPDVVSTTDFGDFREVAGVTYAFELTTLVEPPGQVQTVRVTDFAPGVDIDPARFAPPSEDVRDFKFASGGPYEVVPMRFHENHIYVLVEMEGHSGLWVLDSGASITCIDNAFADDLGLKPEGEMEGMGAGSTVKVSFVRIPEYSVGGVSFQSQVCASIDIAPLFAKTGDLEIVGILGYDFLSRFVTRVDYAREELTFYDPEAFAYDGDGVIVDAALVGNTFAVPVRVDGEPAGRWGVDLGASGESFHYPYAKSHGLLERDGYERVAFGAGGRMAKNAVLFDSIEVAGFAVDRPVIGVPREELVGAFGSSEISGNLGNSFFRRFVLYLDYVHQDVIFERGEDLEAAFPFDRSGLQIWWGEPGVVEVLHAAPGGPAASAGVENGDVITAINGIPAEYFAGLSAIRELLRSEPGTTYEIDALRDGEAVRFTMTLAGILE